MNSHGTSGCKDAFQDHRYHDKGSFFLDTAPPGPLVFSGVPDNNLDPRPTTTKHKHRVCTTLHCIIYCCFSFLMGYSFASISVTSESFFVLSGIAVTTTSSDDGPCLVGESSSKTLHDQKRRDQKRSEVFNWIDELLDSAIEARGSVYGTNITGSDMRLLVQDTILQNFGCDKGTTVVAKNQSDDATAEHVQVQESDEINIRQRRVPGSIDYLSGVGRVDRKDFNSIVDTGVPLFLTNEKKTDVLMLYGSSNTLPEDSLAADSAAFAGTDDLIPAEEAIKNCKQLSVIHLKGEIEDKCWAFVPGQESFHVQKWLRVAHSTGSEGDSSMPLRLVPRGYDAWNGAQYPNLPNAEQSQQHRLWLGEYFLHADALAAELKPIAERVAVNNQLVFTVVNAGQSEMLLNFACAASSRGLDITKVLAFVLDVETKEMVEGLGMAAYYNEKFLGTLPSNVGRYGDGTFASVVIAKLMGPHLLSILGYDFLAQDVDLIWYKDPLTFFNNPQLADPNIDIFFQDDVNVGIRFQPWRGNSGFYFVRSNDRTRAALKDFVMRTDHLATARCDQQTFLEVVSEQVSLWGLRIKTFDADDTVHFPAGGHFHLKKDFMKKFLEGQFNDDLFVFHMNWTSDKHEKMAYLRQLGLWYVQDTCVEQSLESTFATLSDLRNKHGNHLTISDSCCSKEPLFSCQYRDKPSLKPCVDSPATVDDSPSWW